MFQGPGVANGTPGTIQGPAVGKTFFTVSRVARHPSALVKVLAGQGDTIDLQKLVQKSIDETTKDDPVQNYTEFKFLQLYGLRPKDGKLRVYSVPKGCVIAELKPIYFIKNPTDGGPDSALGRCQEKGVWQWLPDHTVMVGSWIACVDPEGLEKIVDEETKNSDVKSLEQYHSNFMVSAHLHDKLWPEHGCMQKS